MTRSSSLTVDLKIQYAVTPSSLGFVLVARSKQGLCAVLLGDKPMELEQDLSRRFPSTPRLKAEDDLQDLSTRVLHLLETPSEALDYPLHITGTPFQLQVWEAIRGIPAGCTASYSEIAHRISAPQSVRAVAGACGANRLAVAIPCHRVVRTDGELSGYRWGIERKRLLLEREACSTADRVNSTLAGPGEMARGRVL